MSTQDAPSKPQYAHGHHSTVLKSHLWRTVANSAAYVVPHLTPTTRILDVGCGPGTITTDLARLVPQGEVIGLDSSEAVIEQAKNHAAEKGLANITFETGDLFHLRFADNEFDVVHAHQVLQHLHEPVSALKEMYRVVKPGGVVAVRDMTHFLHYPEVSELYKFSDLFFRILEDKGVTPGCGKMLHIWARQAGFDRSKMEVGTSNWSFTAGRDLDFWCDMWTDRILSSDFKHNALNTGLTSEEELERISNAHREFGKNEDGWYIVVNGEVIARK